LINFRRGRFQFAVLNNEDDRAYNILYIGFGGNYLGIEKPKKHNTIIVDMLTDLIDVQLEANTVAAELKVSYNCR